MKLREENKDLFAVDDTYYLAHCISGDYALGAGIAVQFNKRFGMREKLHDQYPLPPWSKYANVGKALLVDRVFNLVTKSRYYDKPTYDNIRRTLYDMRDQCEQNGIKRIAMPRIGCGLDRCSWNKVLREIQDVFGSTDIEIIVCRWSKQDTRSV